MKSCLFLFIIIIGSVSITGQEIPKRFAFAKAYFGVDFNYVPSYGESKYLNNIGQIEDFTRSSYISPSINI